MSIYPQENAILTIQFQVTEEDGETPKDISTATAVKFVCKKSNGVKASFDAEFVTDGVDGMVQYSTKDGDLVPAGVWQLQVEFLNPAKTRTETLLFPITPNLFGYEPLAPA